VTSTSVAQFVDGGGDVAGLRRRDLQRVGRVVGGQHHAVAVDDEPAVGHDRHDGGAVAFGAVGQLVVAHHLQVDQPRADQPEAEEHHAADDQQAAAKARELGAGVANFILHRENKYLSLTSRECRVR
jgi:hypothetical protein